MSGVLPFLAVAAPYAAILTFLAGVSEASRRLPGELTDLGRELGRI